MLSDMQTVAVEMFAILGMPCSAVDDRLGMVGGYAHDAVTDWWKLTHEGYECDAVVRWMRLVDAFSLSGTNRQYVEFRGYDSKEAREMLDATIRSLRLAGDMRAVAGDGRAWLERRGRR